jgi:2-polyprenyl-3-methyl-5-hydroxy-6-metoxy-1,4-benzoquinol methylase
VNKEIAAQRYYWNNEADAFQRIYTHRKSKFSNLLDSVFRKDMYERYLFTIKHCEPIQGRAFLDVGCGNGLYSLELARRGARKVLGLDISEVMIELCNGSSNREGLGDKCEFLHRDLLNYEDDTKFDVSFGIGLFDYISDPLPVLARMRQRTTDKAIFAFPRFWTWRAPIRKMRLNARGCDVFFYTSSQIKGLMKQAGFKRHEIYQVGKLHCVIAYP